MFARGPIGLCATVGAQLMDARTVIAVERLQARRDVALHMDADLAIEPSDCDAVSEIMWLMDGRGVDVAIKALGRQETPKAALRVLRSGGKLSSFGVYGRDLAIPLDAFAAGLGGLAIRSTLCPGGKERVRRLMGVVESGCVDLSGLVTHDFGLDDVEAACDLFAKARNGVLKVAIRP